MRWFELVGLATFLVLGLYLLVGGLLADGGGRARATGDTVDLFFMSSLSRGTVSPNDFCTLDRTPVVHSPNRGIDVVGDSIGDLCTDDVSSTVRLRGWGFGDEPLHHTMGGWASGGASPTACDVVLVGLIDVEGGLHGQLRNLHHSRTISTGEQMKFYSAPVFGAQKGHTMGNSTYDADCGWSKYSVHQGTLLDCMDVNDTLDPETEYDTWDLFAYINVITYTEGLHGCDT